MEIISKSRFVRVAPDKARILANSIKGKNISSALASIKYSGKFSALRSIELLLKQAEAVIKDKNILEEDVVIKRIEVNEASKLKRRRILHRGRTTSILKRRSHLTCVLFVKETPKSPIKTKDNLKKGKYGTKNKSN